MLRPVLVVDPGLGITASELEARWNADPVASAQGHLEPVDTAHRSFDPTLGAMAITFVVAVATGVTTNLVTDALRRLLADRVPAEELEIDSRRDAQGNEQLILRRKTGR